jgi:MFS family permease
MGYPTGQVNLERERAGQAQVALHGDLGRIVWEGALSNVFVLLTGGAFVTGLALMLGASDFEIGLLAALPFLAQAAQPLSVLLPGVVGHRKRLALIGLTVGRQVWWLVVPLLFVQASWPLTALLAVVTVSALSTMLVTPVWLAWISDIVPAEIRGRFFGSRSARIAVTTLVFGILGSLLLDWSRGQGHVAAGFAAIIVLAAVAAGLASVVLSGVSDRPSVPPTPRLYQGGWLRPVRDFEYRRILRVFVVWNFAVGLSAPFFAPHMLVNLKMSFLLIGLYSGATSILAVASNRPWGKLIDRFGSRNVLTLCGAGIGLIPLIWLVPRAGYLGILVFEAIYSGLLWAGFNLAAFTLPIDKSPRDDRAYYLAWFAAVTGLAFFAASILGGLLAESLSSFLWTVGGQSFVNYHVVFVVSAGLRVASVGLLYALTEPSERKVPMMVQLMGYAVLKRLSLGRQILPEAAENKANITHNETGPGDQS